MKKSIYLSILFGMLSATGTAQMLHIEKGANEVIELPIEKITEMKFKTDATTSFEDKTPECVEIIDLGLSVNWASVNLGAESQGEPGYLIAWGELEEKDWYSWSYYKFGNSKSTLTKYNLTDGMNTLQSEDDAATMLWGGSWRIPTREEWQELVDNCDVDFAATENGYPGVRFTSKVPGYEDKSIFLCAAGCIQDEYHLNDVTLSSYWSNECVVFPGEISLPEFAFAAEFWREGDYANKFYYSGVYRWQGRPIRAVTTQGNPSTTNENILTSLIVELTDGSTLIYISTNHPIVTFEEEYMHINSDLLETKYKMQNVARFYFEQEDVSVENVVDNQTIFFYDGHNIVVNGESCQLSIYDINGKTYYNAFTADGLNTIDISGYTPGIYIVKANNQSIKIMKK